MSSSRSRSRAPRAAVLFVLSLLVSACYAPVGASTTSVPKDGASECASQCGLMGLRLSAVAIMADHVGCVCQPGPTSPQGPGASGEQSVGASGMATILMMEEQERRQKQAQVQPTLGQPARRR